MRAERNERASTKVEQVSPHDNEVPTFMVDMNRRTGLIP